MHTSEVPCGCRMTKVDMPWHNGICLAADWYMPYRYALQHIDSNLIPCSSYALQHTCCMAYVMCCTAYASVLHGIWVPCRYALQHIGPLWWSAALFVCFFYFPSIILICIFASVHSCTHANVSVFFVSFLFYIYFLLSPLLPICFVCESAFVREHKCIRDCVCVCVCVCVVLLFIYIYICFESSLFSSIYMW